MTNHKNPQKPIGSRHDDNKDRAETKAPGKQKEDHKPMKKQNMPDPDEEPMTNNDLDPEKRIEIDDDPEQTKRKIPHMGK